MDDVINDNTQFTQHFWKDDINSFLKVQTYLELTTYCKQYLPKRNAIYQRDKRHTGLTR